jgi:hypothetical protein
MERIALFIDGANLYATAKSLGFDIDYKRLLKEYQNKGYLVRAFYYTALIEDQEYSSIRPLIDWLDYNGYRVVTKPTKEFVDSTGRRKVSGHLSRRYSVGASRCRLSRRSRRSRQWSPTSSVVRRTNSSILFSSCPESGVSRQNARRAVRSATSSMMTILKRPEPPKINGKFPSFGSK